VTHGRIAPAMVADPGFVDTLTDAQVIAWRYFHEAWQRPEQVVTPGPWRYHLWICGRGWGKTTFSIAPEINRRVEAGEARSLAFMAPTEDRVDEVQFAALIETAPPWFRPERWRGQLRWPNGVTALAFTPEAPGRTRSGNFDLAWLTEIVDWQATTRMEAFRNITTATRVGAAQVFGDTTTQGRNDVIEHWIELCKSDPITYPLTTGEMFDNPMLSRVYVAAQLRAFPPGTRRHDEELRGLVFTGTAGALWKQEWIDAHRVLERPASPDLVLVAIDPALSDRRDADPVGFSVGSRANAHAYVEQDLTDRMKPEQWGPLAIEQYFARGAAGAVIERNRMGDNAVFILRSCAKDRGLVLRVVEAGKPFPSRTPGVFYVKEYTAASSKATRAGGPANEARAGRVHHVGRLDDLEYEMTTFEPGDRKSPNRLDAAAALVAELLELAEERPRAAARRDVAAGVEANEALRKHLVTVKGRGMIGL
jgi:phage terminase large subunit-like protein